MANETESSGDFPEAYIRFRTLLDGLELVAMRYFLKDKDHAKRIARAQEFEKTLMPIITEYKNKLGTASKNNMSSASASIQSECPEGTYSCSGCCVSYPCP